MAESSERSIFLQALDEKSPEAREAFLESACAGDAKLRATVESLLSAHELPDHPLDRPVAVLESKFGDEPVAEAPGTNIGPYKLMEQIGEGGFGLVFVAEQQQPVRRKVALKIIKPGMDTRDFTVRFEAERQALAMMDHPNIARVFDAGATNAGRPYFVMELVRGVPITEFCDQQQLDMRRRLELFVATCHAVQHAHLKGVIHRDLKPSNVLVTLHDGTPVAKVIDFGVAKAIGEPLTDKTIYTRFAAMIGTPLYMSPEQAEMSALDVDTRSDIYSLGVVLYELLTGSTPFESDRLRRAGLDELRRIIRDEEPPKPSTRLSTLGQTLSTVSASRNIEASRLPALVRGDLDWIVMKAMEKDRTRRYETAAELAADVQRFLADQPIEARPPSPIYRFRKYARRHKVTIATVSLVAAAMILGTVVSIWQAARALDERNEKELALNEAVQAQSEADEARRSVEQFAERLTQASVLMTTGRAHADAGRWSAAYADYAQATELQPKYYLVWVERGSFFVRLGLWDRAAEDYSQAMKLGAPTDGPSWWGVPQLLWYTGDKKGYRKAAAEMLRDPASGDLDWHEVRAGLIAPSPVVDPAQLADHAERMLKEDRVSPPRGQRPGGRPPDGLRPGRLGGPGPPPDADRNGSLGRSPGANGSPNGWSLYTTGWAHYRAGNFDNARTRLEESNAARWPGQGIAYPLLAMAHHRSGRGDEARQALAAADQMLERWTAERSRGEVGTMPFPWFDWIEFLVLHREAKILITGFAPPDDPRLREVQQRALAAIQADEALDTQ